MPYEITVLSEALTGCCKSQVAVQIGLHRRVLKLDWHWLCNVFACLHFTDLLWCIDHQGWWWCVYVGIHRDASKDPLPCLALVDNEHAPLLIDMGSHWVEGIQPAGTASALVGIRITQIVSRELSPRTQHFPALHTARQVGWWASWWGWVGGMRMQQCVLHMYRIYTHDLVVQGTDHQLGPSYSTCRTSQ